MGRIQLQSLFANYWCIHMCFNNPVTVSNRIMAEKWSPKNLDIRMQVSNRVSLMVKIFDNFKLRKKKCMSSPGANKLTKQKKLQTNWQQLMNTDPEGLHFETLAMRSAFFRLHHSHLTVSETLGITSANRRRINAIIQEFAHNIC